MVLLPSEKRKNTGEEDEGNYEVQPHAKDRVLAVASPGVGNTGFHHLRSTSPQILLSANVGPRKWHFKKFPNYTGAAAPGGSISRPPLKLNIEKTI